MTDTFMVREGRIHPWLQAFERDPGLVMDSPVPKSTQVDEDALMVRPISAENAQKKDFFADRNAIRYALYRREALDETRAAASSNDRAENLVDRLAYTTVEAMHSAGLTQAQLAESPWSGDYWGLYKGLLGVRYADPHFPASVDWKSNFDYIRQHDARAIWQSGNAAQIDLLSPAEKYDALVGDENGSLTRRMWSEGKYYYDAGGQVETWMGICHGWAPASFMLPRPRRAVRVRASGGRAITFYPSDLKGLASLLWANAMPATRFIGGRCTDANPAKDPQTGRILSTQCFDTNPGTWHLAVVNQVGAVKRGMVMDATYDYEVWNQPVYAYQYSYFNPATLAASSHPAAAKVALRQFTRDKFRRYRSSSARYAIGIRMQVKYIAETAANHHPTDTPRMDAVSTVEYHYDLELDANSRIIGGEWYTNRHPDFLWTPPPGVKAQSRSEHIATGNWQGDQTLPASWQVAAQQAARGEGVPLARIVERLLALAGQ